MRYFFGADKMLFKWQPVTKIRCEMLAAVANSATLINDLPFQPLQLANTGTLLIEFGWDEKLEHWEMLNFRTDKQKGNSIEVIEELTNICKHPFPLVEALNAPYDCLDKGKKCLLVAQFSLIKLFR
jgi:hypothetical protein